ncbi:hypothetical protein EOA32_18630 [Mesorhizobium sp. M1A.F.Ca.ET.072.01.1.1]|uniref:hypothetical protein n=1 Tax=Mesorhizobium sp. M1A.F.Ca.ET.072.01.1.1 TaxID=2496753 RepID=UPI000FD31768|nr:hypothetical protein [Mesorhizobium sp. M1A.F.Ca.ET.072.01.1.1]RUW50619.1 hypothetical protein EOA32_18630 [Mesorhizobium sp. M1A.F.Ca.ET.072.01.1.1]
MAKHWCHTGRFCGKRKAGRLRLRFGQFQQRQAGAIPGRLSRADGRHGFSTSANGDVSFYGHARIAISIREGHCGFVTCGLMGNSADKVVNSFVLDAP